MHYSVTESAGTVKIAIKRKTLHNELSFGVRTRRTLPRSEETMTILIT